MRLDARLALHDNEPQGAAKLLTTAIEMLIAIAGAESVEIARLEHDLADVLERIPGGMAEASRYRSAALARMKRLEVGPAWARDARAVPGG